MATLEERVAVLETRVDELTTSDQHTNDLAATAVRQALASREAHTQNLRLLQALRETQIEHGQTLAEHSALLAEHSRRFDAIDQRLDGIDQRFDGIDQRLDGIDQRFDGIDQRFDGIDQQLSGLTARVDGVHGKLGMLAMGMHDIQLMLGQLIAREDGASNGDDPAVDAPS